ncbi:2-hydroxychromene-2-carboxylate isomerase [Ramlibacter sp. AN1015]|uniref:2-hydroxychromene-2-carboxylate isomerase n=1 Tax=Ramlibacter sp. AN1015 TaxID=3133428 RepID=UPI0030BF14BE
MKHITFHLDFVSPYAYLAFEQLPQALLGLSYRIDYRPVLFGAILAHYGQLGPAEVPGKREWTYRQVQWLARQHGIPLHLPATHPFNPLPLLRLALACGDGGLVNRWACETVLRHVWLSEADAVDPQRLAQLRAELAPRRDSGDAEVKAELRANTDAAIAAGVFGVPALAVDDRLFWGFDALPMLRAYLEGDAWFDTPAWHEAGQRPGVQRAR